MADEVRNGSSSLTRPLAGAAGATGSATLGGGAGSAAAAAFDMSRDRFVLVHIEGMHCHRCEQAICKSVHRRPGVHEVEVDFASGQASILYDARLVTPAEFVEAVREAGYKPTGFSQSHMDLSTSA